MIARSRHARRSCRAHHSGHAPGARLATLFVPVCAMLLAVVLLAVATAAAGCGGSPDEQAAPGDVWTTSVDGIVDPAMAGFLVELMEDAAAAQAAALVVEIDTPGGLDTAMRDIIQAEIDAPIAVVFYVSPQGARAASAGLYILMGADVAAMAPQTNLGAATPVSMGEEMDETMQAKVTNDAAAYIRALATEHDRNADWAEQAVREAVSLPAEEALELGVIEFVSPDLPTLLQDIDGYTTVSKGLTLQTAGVPVHEVGMGFIQRFLHLIANPNIAYVLLTLGVLGIILEISSPGIGAGGVVGFISLLLAFYSLQVLPVNFVGIALIVAAVALFVAEIFIASNGILGIGGGIALVLGGLLLFDTPATYLRVSWPVLVVVAVIVLAFIFVVIRAITKARHRPVATGVQGLVGTTGIVVTPVAPEGQVRVHGETWRARSTGDDLHKDEDIEVLDIEGLTLIVQKRTLGHDAGDPRPGPADVDTSQETQGQ